ncbi:DUF1287 domain-containing protein [Aquabacterium sp. A7-Y]|uniref:DUF1287 domain-containing protein n=1 Tax=Aquabacterium sp. A7-Y TaxID=1349605 RepID=UPI00223E3AF8|nr:DUF1287 domain-containing protein [Aquabacterium sp. A7-Y]MCW7538668.1 DUF1287 domain-containing protein [Aquabacterium sp. A7-Y]
MWTSIFRASRFRAPRSGAERGRRATAWAAACLIAGCLAGPAAADTGPERLVEAARRQIGVTTHYDGSYRRLAYPGGDVPDHTGVCTDVVVRAYRRLGVDLQRLVHEDMSVNWSAYPRRWGLRRPDPNIDHRRVPNLQVFFRRQGYALPVSGDPGDYQAGDLVTWELPGRLPHIGIVSSRSVAGRPLVLHNIGRGTQEEDVLFAYPITGHYRGLPARR